MAAMMCSSAMLARTTAPRLSVRSRAVKCAAAKPARQAPVRKSHNESMKKVAPVLGGVVALGLAQVLAPAPAAALSITDPVFGDIEVWQFIVLTAAVRHRVLSRQRHDDDDEDARQSAQGVRCEEVHVRRGCGEAGGRWFIGVNGETRSGWGSVDAARISQPLRPEIAFRVKYCFH